MTLLSHHLGTYDPEKEPIASTSSQGSKKKGLENDILVFEGVDSADDNNEEEMSGEEEQQQQQGQDEEDGDVGTPSDFFFQTPMVTESDVLVAI